MSRRPREPASMSLNLAPMVDVMMCLLIFFMLAAKLIERRQAAVPLPQSSSAAPQSGAGRLVVNVRNTERGAGYSVDDQPVTPVELAERLEAEVERDAGVTCTIRADRDLPFRCIEPIMVHCARLKIAKVTFAAEPIVEGG
ncbi:MAG: biopolymer transporter ExbD [Phycisphaerae bacterium]